MEVDKHTCEKCPNYKNCVFVYKDLEDAKYLCTYHPKYGFQSILKSSIESQPTVLSENKISFESYPGFNDTLTILKPTYIRKIMFGGSMYNIEYLEAFNLIKENNVDIYAIKYLDKEGKLSLENYNDYIDTSISKPLIKEDFELILKQLL